MLYPKKLQPWYRNVDLMRDGLLTSKEAARFLAISRTKIYDAMSSGDLPYVKLGKARRIPKVALSIFAEQV